MAEGGASGGRGVERPLVKMLELVRPISQIFHTLIGWKGAYRAWTEARHLLYGFPPHFVLLKPWGYRASSDEVGQCHPRRHVVAEMSRKPCRGQFDTNKKILLLSRLHVALDRRDKCFDGSLAVQEKQDWVEEQLLRPADGVVSLRPELVSATQLTGQLPS